MRTPSVAEVTRNKAVADYESGLCTSTKLVVNDPKIKIQYIKSGCPSADIKRRVMRVLPMNGLNAEELAQARTFYYHEGGHLLHTADLGKDQPTGALMSISNALEDVRIENELSKEHVGLQMVFHESLPWANKLVSKEVTSGAAAKRPLWEANCAMTLMHRGVRPMWTLSDTAARYVGLVYEDFQKVRDCRNTRDVVELAKVILKKLMDDKTKPEEDDPEDGDGEGEGEEGGESKKGKSKKSKKGGKEKSEKDKSEAGKDKGDKKEGKDKEKREGKEKGEKESKKGKEKGDDEGSAEDEDGDDSSEGEGEDEGEEGGKEKSEDGEEEGAGDDEGEGEKGSDEEGDDEGGAGSSELEDEKDEDSKGSGSGEEEGDEEGESESKGKGDDEGKGGDESKPSKSDADAEGTGDAGDEEGEKKEREYDPEDTGRVDSGKTPEEAAKELDGESEGKDIYQEIAKELEKHAEMHPGEYSSVSKDDVYSVPESYHGDQERFVAEFGKVSTKAMALAQSLEQAIRVLTACRKQGHMPRGKLDTKRLASLLAGVDNRVFWKKDQGMALDVSVTILVDESGSMHDNFAMANVRPLSMLLGEALDAIHVPFEMVGHTTTTMCAGRLEEGFDRTIPLQIDIIKTFNEPWKNVRTRTVHLQAQNQNVDGEALDIAVRRIAGRREKRKVVLVLSDGEPHSGHGNNAVLGRHLKKVAKDARAAGIEVYAVGVGTTAPKAFYGEENFMYVKSINDLGNATIKKFCEVITKGRLQS